MLETRDIAADIESAREWLQDNQWSDMDPEDFEDLSPLAIVRGIRRYYEGGWGAFIRECCSE